MGCTTFQEALRVACEVQIVLRDALNGKGLGHSNSGAFGGFTPQFSTCDEALDVVAQSLSKVQDQLKTVQHRQAGTTIDAVNAASMTTSSDTTATTSNDAVHEISFGLGIDVAAHVFAVMETESTVSYNLDMWNVPSPPKPVLTHRYIRPHYHHHRSILFVGVGVDSLRGVRVSIMTRQRCNGRPPSPGFSGIRIRWQHRA